MKNQQRKRHGTLEILGNIANLVNESNEKLNISRIARKVGCTWRTAKKCVTVLTSLGWITQTERKCQKEGCHMVSQWIGTNNRGFCFGILKKARDKKKHRDIIRLCMIEKDGRAEFYDLMVEEAFFVAEALHKSCYFKMLESYPLKE